MSGLSLFERLIGTKWVCTNCIMIVANGDDSGRSEDDPEPLTKLAGFEITPGFGYEDHEEGCPNGDPDTFGYEECYCETRDFSWTYCDGCEDGLGGERHAVTVWAPEGATVNPDYKIGGHYWLDRDGNPL